MHGLPPLHQRLAGGDTGTREGCGDAPQDPPNPTRGTPPPTCSMSLVRRAAASLCARAWSSSWYWRQFLPSWMAWAGGEDAQSPPPRPPPPAQRPPSAGPGLGPTLQRRQLRAPQTGQRNSLTESS